MAPILLAAMLLTQSDPMPLVGEARADEMPLVGVGRADEMPLAGSYFIDTTGLDIINWSTRPTTLVMFDDVMVFHSDGRVFIHGKQVADDKVVFAEMRNLINGQCKIPPPPQIVCRGPNGAERRFDIAKTVTLTVGAGQWDCTVMP